MCISFQKFSKVDGIEWIEVYCSKIVQIVSGSGWYVIVDDNGKEIEFNSMVDAANYMVERGWVFQQAYSSVYFSKKPVLHWIFYKDANSFEEAREGILTKEEYKKQKK